MERKAALRRGSSKLSRSGLKGGTKKLERLEARIGTDTKVLFQQAAALEGRSLSEFVVTSAVEAAKRTLRESELIELSRRDRIAFVKTLLNPPPPNARLRKAFQRYKRIVAER